jgi:hypothetical protein
MNNWMGIVCTVENTIVATRMVAEIGRMIGAKNELRITRREEYVR